MFLDPMAITLNIPDRDDGNTLKVPTISPVDGRYIVKDEYRHDSVSADSRSTHSAISSPNSRGNDRPTLIRPVSDQNINRVRNRKEKAVSWHNKIPGSTQTLGCVEDTVPNSLDNEEKHTQSHPLLGTLESSSPRRHICKHTYSVKHYRTKESSKPSILRRSFSTGNDKGKSKDQKYSPLPTSASKDEDSDSKTLTQEQLPSQDSVGTDGETENVKSEEVSLIDWEEDELLCDQEVSNITGHMGASGTDGPSTPTPTQTVTRSIDISDTELDAYVHVCDTDKSVSSIDKHSACAAKDPVEHNHSFSTTDTTVNDGDSQSCDPKARNYAVLVEPEPVTSSKTTSHSKPSSRNYQQPCSNMLGVPTISLLGDAAPHARTNEQQKPVETLKLNHVPVDERRPPIRQVPPTEESHL